MQKNILAALICCIISQPTLATDERIDVVSREEFNAFKAEITASITGLAESINHLSSSLNAKLAKTEQHVANLDTTIGKTNVRIDDLQSDLIRLEDQSNIKFVSKEQKTLSIAGDSDHYYPVVFKINTTRTQLNSFHFSNYIHTKPKGSQMRFFIDVSAGSYGGLPFYLAPTAYNFRGDEEIADYRIGAHGYVFVIWLKGDSVYHYQSSTGITGMIFLEEVNLMDLFEGYENTAPDVVAPTTEVNQAHMVPNGFRRWDPSTYGSYQASVAQPQQAAASIFPLINK